MLFERNSFIAFLQLLFKRNLYCAAFNGAQLLTKALCGFVVDAMLKDWILEVCILHEQFTEARIDRFSCRTASDSAIHTSFLQQQQALQLGQQQPQSLHQHQHQHQQQQQQQQQGLLPALLASSSVVPAVSGGSGDMSAGQASMFDGTVKRS